jgi:hypothetical protein
VARSAALLFSLRVKTLVQHVGSVGDVSACHFIVERTSRDGFGSLFALGHHNLWVQGTGLAVVPKLVWWLPYSSDVVGTCAGSSSASRQGQHSLIWSRRAGAFFSSDLVWVLQHNPTSPPQEV